MKLKKGDRFRVAAPTESGFLVERDLPDGTVDQCAALPVADGRPIPPGASQIVTTKAVDDVTREVTDVLDVPSTHKGPARVSTPAYRDGYDRIFGDTTEWN